MYKSYTLLHLNLNASMPVDRRRRNQNFIPDLISSDDTVSISEQEKAYTFTYQYQSIYSSATPCHSHDDIGFQPQGLPLSDLVNSSHRVTGDLKPDPQHKIFFKNVEDKLVNRWELVQTALRQEIKNFAELKQAILSYNNRYKTQWNFAVLGYLLETNSDKLPGFDQAYFFHQLLPKLCALALNLPILITEPIPLMKRGHQLSYTFSQLQLASLLANAFFCTYPRRNSTARNAEMSTYPSINFNRLLCDQNIDSPWPCKVEKVRCLLHYFNRMLNDPPASHCGCVTFTRRRLEEPDDNNSCWPATCQSTFDQLRLHVDGVGTIESAGSGTLKVDFANRYLGGGVLGFGCVQEEIMFVEYPELLASCLFAQSLDRREAFLFEGVECFSRWSGYSATFEWLGDFNQSHSGLERDAWGRWDNCIVAIDAIRYRSIHLQTKPEAMLREVNKAYCGFANLTSLAPGRPLPSVVATGNWGCGAFGGNVYIKFLLQLIACLRAGKDMAYFTFGDCQLANDLIDMTDFLRQHKVSVAMVWAILIDFKPSRANSQLFQLIKKCVLSASSTNNEQTISTGDEQQPTVVGDEDKGEVDASEAMNSSSSVETT